MGQALHTANSGEDNLPDRWRNIPRKRRWIPNATQSVLCRLY